MCTIFIYYYYFIVIYYITVLNCGSIWQPVSILHSEKSNFDSLTSSTIEIHTSLEQHEGGQMMIFQFKANFLEKRDWSNLDMWKGDFHHKILEKNNMF